MRAMPAAVPPKRSGLPSRSVVDEDHVVTSRERAVERRAHTPIRLLLFKMGVKIVDPVMGSFQLRRIKRQCRTLEATNIRMTNLVLGGYPSVGRLQLCNVGRQALDEIVRRNDRSRVIFPNN